MQLVFSNNDDDSDNDNAGIAFVSKTAALHTTELCFAKIQLCLTSERIQNKKR